jgi:hypothetical protein
VCCVSFFIPKLFFVSFLFVIQKLFHSSPTKEQCRKIM